MAYIDVGGKTILDAYGKFQAVLYADCVVGDALARDTTNEGFILADASTSIPAACFALEDGVAGETIWMALAIIIEVRPTVSDGVWSDGVLALDADVCDLLYLGESGKVSDSSGTLVQTIGIILSVTRALLTPSQYLTSTDLSLSGTLAVTGTLTQTGIATFAAAAVFSAGFAVAVGYFISGPPVKMTETTKSDDATLTVAEAGLIVVSADGKTMTLPAASGNAGLRYIILVTDTHSDGVVVDGNASETIGGAATKTSPAQYSVLEIVVNAAGTAWHVIGTIGTWT